MHRETAVSFVCHGERLIGILHHPEVANSQGVVIIVGGPQYRAGSHRQFLLLARSLADRGIPAFRFDYRGMGDSEGGIRNFESISDDIRSAIDCFQENQSGVERIALWGLCDAASAASFYAHSDPRINGLALLNPWVRSESGVAKAYLKHYYREKLLHAETWRRLFRGEISLRTSFKSVLGLIGRMSGFKSLGEGTAEGDRSDSRASPDEERVTLADRMLAGLSAFNGNVLLILSGNDLTAAEFKDTVDGSKSWKRLLTGPRFQKHEIADADHTFSRGVWRKQVEVLTRDWIERQLLP